MSLLFCNHIVQCIYKTTNTNPYCSYCQDIKETSFVVSFNKEQRLFLVTKCPEDWEPGDISFSLFKWWALVQRIWHVAIKIATECPHLWFQKCYYMEENLPSHLIINRGKNGILIAKYIPLALTGKLII
mgnify:CR=1 FL=1